MTVAVQARASRAVVLAIAAIAVLAAGMQGCTEVGTGPDEPAAIELAPFPSPSVVVGDSLRDLAGAVAPVVAIVRNVRGDVIATAPVRYFYADNPRDTALVVDSATGTVVALKATKDNAPARIVARVGSSLQVIRTLVVTMRPDTISGDTTPALFTTTLPDTGRTGAGQNRAPAFSVRVQHRANATAALAPVNAWPVRFELVRPANPTNDTTASVYLVDESGRASTLDTTSGGTAGRQVRVRAAQFPAAGRAIDTVIVHATASYRGVLLRGAPVRIVLPVRRDSTP